MKMATKIWLGIFLILIAAAAAVGYHQWMLETESRSLQKQQAGAIAQISSTNLGAALWFGKIAFINKVLQPLENDKNISFIYVADRAKNRLYGFQDEAYLEQIRRFRDSERLDSEGDDFYFVKRDIFYNNEFQGELIIGFGKAYLAKLDADRRQRMLLFLGGLALTLFILAFYVSRRVLARLRQASDKIRQFNEEDPAVSPLIEASGRKNELAGLAGAYNDLIGNLSENWENHGKNAAWLDAFFRLSSMPILIADADGKIDKANESACEFFEISQENIENAKLDDLISTHDYNTLIEHSQKNRSDIQGYVAIISTELNKKYVVELNLSRLTDDEGQVKNVILTVVDITEKVQTQHELLENQTRLANVNRELNEKTAALESANHNSRQATEKLSRLIESSYAMIRCRTVEQTFSVLLSGGKDILEADDGVIFRSNEEGTRLMPYKTLTARLIGDLDSIGKDEGLVWQTFQQKEAFWLKEEEVEDADLEQLRIRRVANLCLIAVPIFDQDVRHGVVLYIKKRQTDAREGDIHLLTTLGHLAAITLENLNLVGEIRDKASHLEEVNGQLTESQKQVIQLQKMESLGTLVGGIAHDFNNILGIITPNLDLLKMSAKESDQVLKRASIIQQAAERATGLTRQLLIFSRNQDVKLEPVSVNELLAQLVKMMQPSMGKSIDIITELNIATPNILGDRIRLTQVLMNLAINARDAMPKGGQIVFRTSLDDYAPRAGVEDASKYVHITVEDTGIGIEPENMDKIFDPFFTTKSVGKGTGLGLSVVYGIVQSHKGHIECSSKPGSGTRFDIYFPPTDKPARPYEEEDLELLPFGHETIMVVDDEDLIRESLRDSLESFGYTVIAASSGEEALGNVREGTNIQCAIVDVAMPDKDGVETARELRDLAPAMKIVLTSGYGEQQGIYHSDVAVDGFLPKPYHLNDLALIVRRILTRQNSNGNGTL